MDRTWVKYFLIFLGVILIGVFIYPTIYKYDKLDQKYPVKINRISGSTEVLMGTEWVPTDKKVVAEINEVEDLKKQIFDQMSKDREALKQEIIQEIKNEIISGVQSELDSVKEEIIAYKTFETDPDNYFSKGDSMEKVKEIMGTPDTINENDYLKKETWFYSSAFVTFQNGKVRSWSDFNNVLRVK